MTLFEVAQWDHRRLVLHGVRELQTWLERSHRGVGSGDHFQVRVRGRLIFSGSFPEAVLRYERARDAQLWRRLEVLERRRRLPRARARRRPSGTIALKEGPDHRFR